MIKERTKVCCDCTNLLTDEDGLYYCTASWAWKHGDKAHANLKVIHILTIASDGCNSFKRN